LMMYVVFREVFLHKHVELIELVLERIHHGAAVDESVETTNNDLNENLDVELGGETEEGRHSDFAD
jgi:hypothetical protein